MLRIVLAKSHQEASKVADEKLEWVTIETEYGTKSLGEEHPNVSLALNHHGNQQQKDPPALAYKKNLNKRYDNFIISHIDLDVLFGILWSAGWLKKTKTTIEISNLVALADIDGFHTVKPKLKTVTKDIAEKYCTIGYVANSWVVNDNGLTVKDISKEIHKLLLRIKDIILGEVTSDQVQKYETWFIEQEKVAKTHLREIKPLYDGQSLFVYRAPFRLTTAYTLGDIEASIIVQYNEQSKSISLSCFDSGIAEKYFGEQGVIAPLKKYFGSDAGGKNTVGGTSRSHDVQPEMLQGFVEFLGREYFNIPDIIDLTDKIEISGRKIVTIKDKELLKISEGLSIPLLIKRATQA